MSFQEKKAISITKKKFYAPIMLSNSVFNIASKAIKPI